MAISHVNGIAVTTGSTILGRSGLSHINGIALASGGGGAWTDHNSTAATNADGVVPFGDYHWTSITLPSGNAIKLRAYIRDLSFATNIKLSLYNGTTLLQTASIAVSGTGMVEGTIPSTAIVGGSFSLGWTGEDNNACSIGYENGVGTLSYKTAITPYTPPSPLPAAEGTVARKYAIGVFVE